VPQVQGIRAQGSRPVHALSLAIGAGRRGRAASDYTASVPYRPHHDMAVQQLWRRPRAGCPPLQRMWTRRVGAYEL